MRIVSDPRQPAPEHLPRHGRGNPDAVDAGREDTAGVTGTFAGRVQALHVHALTIVTTGDAQRRRSARLDAREHRIRHRKAANLAIKPLVTTRSSSEVAATTVPPGHMQKLYTERPLRQ